MQKVKKFKNQIEMYKYIWSTREHISELSGLPLYNTNHSQWIWQFLHVLPKGTYPNYKLNPDNIILALPEEHEKQETFQEFIKRRDELKRQYYKEFYNKEF